MNDLSAFFCGKGLLEALDHGAPHSLFHDVSDNSHELHHVIQNYLLHGLSRYRLTTCDNGIFDCRYDLVHDIRSMLVRTWDKIGLRDMLESHGSRLSNLVPHHTFDEYVAQYGKESFCGAVHSEWLESIVTTYSDNLATRDYRIPLSVGVDLAAIFLEQAHVRAAAQPEALLPAADDLADAQKMSEFVAGLMRSFEYQKLRWHPRYHSSEFWGHLFDCGISGLLAAETGMGALPLPNLIAEMAMRSGRPFPAGITVILDELQALDYLQSSLSSPQWEGWLCLPVVNSKAGAVLVEDPSAPGRFNIFLYHRTKPVCLVVGTLDPTEREEWSRQIDSYFTSDPFTRQLLHQGSGG